VSAGRTPSQTVGPYFSIGMTWEDGPYAVAGDVPGSTWLRGTVFDGENHPVPDAIVETWQADPDGHFPSWGEPVRPDGFRGFARCATDASGRYAIRTLRPGTVLAPDGSPQAPHIDVSIFARGLLKRLVTRIYLPDNVAENAADPVLAAIDDPDRRATLVAVADRDGYRFDIHLQGDAETIFFEI
jgi:protocatechuate 3,4-dioxygenase alpha subunit